MKKINKIIYFLLLVFSINIFGSNKLSDADRKEVLEIIKIYEEKNKRTENKVINKGEMRGVWVASVWNIDWPSSKILSIENQKEEYIKILDNVEKWNMNAVFVQIKPVGDAFYPSKYAPWSEYLTGIQGVDPGYNPLEFMIEEAHKRGIEFHAWFNPYRLTTSGGVEKLSDDNIGKRKPEWTIKYGKQLYLNPGIPEVNDYVINSIMEVVENYNVDGVHLDDYFYPYKIKDQVYEDSEQYTKYGRNFKNVEDWRRDNINKLVEKLSYEIKKEKKNVSFGISPFGVWRNSSTDPVRGSNTKAGIENYDDLYADILLWMEKGWIDYVAPQIYWNQGHKLAEYNTLVQWWSKYAKETNTKLYIGHAVSKVKDWENERELINQIEYNRRFKEVKGSIFFSYKSLEENPKNVINQLLEGPYGE